MSAIEKLISSVSEETINAFFREHDNGTYRSSEKSFMRGQENARAFFPATYKNVFKSFTICGYSETLNLFVFLIRLDANKSLSERSCRRLQFDYAKSIMKKDHGNYLFHDALTNWMHGSIPFELAQAIFVFADDFGRFRFSLVENLDAKEECSKRFRRYTFYIDQKSTNRTFKERMDGRWTSFEEVKKAFSVERLSDEFFDEYKEIYQRFVEYATGKRMIKQNEKWVEIQTHSAKSEIMDQFSVFGDGEKAFRDYVKKMMGRLVFLQFLQKKGWLGVPAGQDWGKGDKEYMKNLFESKTATIQEDFLDTVLEPLFFDSLNKNRSQNGDLVATILSTNAGQMVRIPYLNGGLFEKDALDGTKVKFPSKYFAGLFNTFERFNFTIDENDPEDAEIGVDPEMLGRIFENLLEDNKDKGAFYTPKEIVRYMCQESLIQYLGENPAIRKLVTEFDDKDIPEEQKAELIEKLKTVKICDPAIGSGAFPMGMLNLLYRLRIKLGDIEDSSHGILQAKKEIIQNNIYGVDIEAGAVDIARLRFWLSIVVDEDIPTPLPNFDYKIMQGNSLLEQYNGVDLKLDLRPTNKKGKKINSAIVDPQPCFEWDDEVKALETVKRAMSDFFTPIHGEDKNNLRHSIDMAVKNYIKTKCGNDPVVNADVDSMNLNEKPFFLWHLYFADVFTQQGGFDIVIGNPPYGANIDSLINEYKEIYSDIIQNFAEIYKIFFDAGFSLLRDNGTLSFITPDTYLTQPRYKDLRKFIHETNIKVIVDLGENVFPLVTVPVCISFLQKRKPEKIYNFLDLKRSYSGDFLFPKYTAIRLIHSETFPLLPIITATLTIDDVMELKDPGIQYHKHGNRGENTLYQRLFSHEENSYAHPVRCWYGQMVSAYKIQETDEFFNSEYRDELRENESVSFTKEVFEKSPKFLWRQTAPYLIAMIDFDRKWHRNTLQCGYIKEEYSEEIDPYFMLAVLNSSYLAYCYDLAVRETGRTFPQIRLTFLRPLPMVIPDITIQQQVRTKVLDAISSTDQSFRTIKQEIDKMILDCFHVSDEQRKQVKSFEERLQVPSRRRSKTVISPVASSTQQQNDEDDARE